jgi:hypothetical protein
VRARLLVLGADGTWEDLGDAEATVLNGGVPLQRVPLRDITVTFETESIADPAVIARLLTTPKPERPSFLEGVRSRLQRRRRS